MLAISPAAVGLEITTPRASSREKNKLGRLDGVSSAPVHDFARIDEFNLCRERLLRGGARALVITSPGETGSMSLETAMSLRGVGGAGKSVLAAALARDESVRARFADGIYWVDAGQGKAGTEARAIKIQADLAKRLGSPLNVATPHLAKNHLQKLLASKSCLIIVDDVRDAIDAQRLEVIERHSASRLLVTSREGSIVNDLEADEVPLASLTDEQAAAYLSEWRKTPLDDAELLDVAAECRFLPSSLAICGALAREGISWADIARGLQSAGPASSRGSFEELGLRAVGLADKALQKASPDIARRFRSLAVFPENVKIPESVVAMYWDEAEGCDARQTNNDLAALARRQLLTLEEGPEGILVSLKNLQHQYVISTNPGLTKANHQLVEAYRSISPEAWNRVPSDGYYFEHLADHLRAAGSHNVVRSLLLNPDWIAAKIKATGIVSLIADYEPFASDHVFGMVQGALRLSAAVLERDPSQLKSQLQARLLGVVPEGVLQQLRDSTDAEPWLKSLSPSLAAPGGPWVRTLDGHHASVRTVVLTADGKHALSASNDKTLRLWNIETGKTVRELRGHTDVVNAVALSPDGRHALSASDDHTLRLWNLGTGETTTELVGHTGIVSAAVFSTDGRYAVSASWDHSLRLWNLGAGTTVSTLRGHTDIVASVVILPDGKRALSASWDHTLRIWDLATGEPLSVLKGHTGRLTAAVITPDGKHALSASWDHTLRLWDLATGETVREFRGHTQLVTAVVITPDGKHALSASHDQTLRLWDLASGKTIHELRGHKNLVNAVVLTTDGKRAISASWDQTLRLWNLATGKSEGELQGHTHLVTGVTLSPDGNQALSTSWDLTLHQWDLRCCESVREVPGQTRSVNAASLSHDGSHALSASFDHTLRYWNVATGKTIRELKGHTNLVTSLALTADGRYALSASWDQTLRLWDLTTGKTIRELRGHEGWISSALITPDGGRALSASNDKTMRLWDLASGRTLREFRGHGDLVNAIAITADGKRALSTSWDHTVRLWDLETGKSLREIGGHAFLTSAALTPDGNHALIASDNPTPRLWNLETGATARELKGHSNLVNGVAITLDGKHALTASDDQTLRLWNLKTAREVSSFAADSPLMNCGVSADGHTLIARESAGKVHVLQLESR